MNFHYQTMLSASNPASVLALVREFNPEARNALAHLHADELACEEAMTETV